MTKESDASKADIKFKKALLEYAATAKNEQTDTNKEPSKSDHALLLELCRDKVDLFQTPSGDSYASFKVNKRRENHPIGSLAFKHKLTRWFFEHFKKGPAVRAVDQTIQTLQAQATARKVCEVHYRCVSTKDDGTFIDLGGKDWKCINVVSGAWREISDPPVRFRRGRHTDELPKPSRGGSIEGLRRFVNLSGDSDWILLVSFVVGAMRGLGPYPILILTGPQGSAKSTLARVLRRVIDPRTEAPIQSLPKNSQDLAVAASHQHLLVFDNLSSLRWAMSDDLCRMATGAGFSTRKLYTDGEESVFGGSRPICLNGITDFATRGDLLDRSIVLNLCAISSTERMDEQTFWADFDKALPSILGGFLDAVATGIQNLPDTHLESSPRMADFARWVVACEPALPWRTGDFLDTYCANLIDAKEGGLEASLVGSAVRDLVAAEGSWTGQATELLRKLNQLDRHAVTKLRTWPKIPQQLSSELRRDASLLEAAGVTVEFVRTGGERLITISSEAEPNDAHDAHDAHDAKEHSLSVVSKEIEEGVEVEQKPSSPSSHASSMSRMPQVIKDLMAEQENLKSTSDPVNNTNIEGDEYVS